MKLYKHQIEVLEQTKNFNRVGYFLDMGLGKTFVGSEKMKDLNTNVNLVVCQKSKVIDWVEHLNTYYKEYKVVAFNKQNLNELLFNNEKLILVINYELVWRREELLALKDFTLILDESSYIKNMTSKRTKFILKLNCKNVILLSGTMIGGKYEEILSQCKLLGWNISKTEFWKRYINYRELPVNNFKLKIVTGYKNIGDLKIKLREHGGIFMKTPLTLPEQVFNVVKVQNTKLYKQFEKDKYLTINDDELIGDTSLTYLLYLRQLAGMYNKNKLEKVKGLLESTEDRLIIFYNFKHEFDLLKEICDKLEKPVSAVNGTVKDLYNYENKSNSVTLIQYQSGAMGLNLQKCNKLIYYTLPLSSELFEQSKKRIHRIGQNKPCIYWILETRDTVETHIRATLEIRKNYTDELFKEKYF